MWWERSSPVPPLITKSPANVAGVLGRRTVVLAGGANTDFGTFSGANFTLGGWLDEEHIFGLEGGGFFLSSRARDYGAAGNGAVGSPTLSRPFLNANTGHEDSEVVATPNLVSGVVSTHASSRLAGGEVNALYNVWSRSYYRVDGLLGFRYFQLNEGIGITEDKTGLPNVPGIGGTTFAKQDQFDTANRFYGGQLGARGTVWLGRLFADATTKIALGAVDEVADIRGVTVIMPSGGVAITTPGGLLAQPTNIGRHTRAQFAVLPEADLDVGLCPIGGLRVFVGYDFLLLSRSLRPGRQIDREVNTSQLTALGETGGLIGPPRPAFVFSQTAFWVQGIHFGLEYRY
jgi:hypothetical protein